MQISRLNEVLASFNFMYSVDTLASIAQWQRHWDPVTDRKISSRIRRVRYCTHRWRAPFWTSAVHGAIRANTAESLFCFRAALFLVLWLEVNHCNGDDAIIVQPLLRGDDGMFAIKLGDKLGKSISERCGVYEVIQASKEGGSGSMTLPIKRAHGSHCPW
jgi:hypothetical protein